MKNFLWVSGLAWIFLGSASALAQGGPPMVTDDPGTPGDGHWEINIAGLLSKEDGNSSTTLQAPYFDINYGLGARLQLKVETGWVFETGSPQRNGGDFVLTGVKFRFLDEETSGIAVSTYPQFQFHSFYTNGNLATPGNQVFLPVEASKAVGDWALNPEVGYLYSTTKTVADQIAAGIVLAFEKAKPWEPLFEVHTSTNLDGTGTATLLNLGFRYTLGASANLIGALGHTVSHFLGSANELDAYLGVQLEL